MAKGEIIAESLTTTALQGWRRQYLSDLCCGDRGRHSLWLERVDVELRDNLTKHVV